MAAPDPADLLSAIYSGPGWPLPTVMRSSATWPATPARPLAREEAAGHLLGSVPMAWMRRWPGPFPLYVAAAEGGRFEDVDGHEYVDLCLGDTGAMGGHALRAVSRGRRRADRPGATAMLPTADAAWVAGELTRRFGLPAWQFAPPPPTPTARAPHRPRPDRAPPDRGVRLCYHGTVDERWSRVTARRRRAPGRIPRPPRRPDRDHAGRSVQRRRRAGHRRWRPATWRPALAEPALHQHRHRAARPGLARHVAGPDPTARRVAGARRDAPICAGPGGATTAWGLEPDLLTIGKPIGGGVPAAAYGLTAPSWRRAARWLPAQRNGARRERPGRHARRQAHSPSPRCGPRCPVPCGKTTSQWPCPSHERWAAGVPRRRRRPTASRGRCSASAAGPSTGSAPRAARRCGGGGRRTTTELDAYLHLHALNRGVLLTPFHNMALLLVEPHRGRRRPPLRSPSPRR